MAKNTYDPMNLRMTVYSALFTALIIIGGYIAIPIGPVPIVLADFFVMLAGLFLGWKWGLASVVLYVFLGTLGLPVFAGGKAGLAVLMGPTGGFLPGYMLMALVIGLIVGRGKSSVLRNVIALTAGNILLFVVGIPWLKMNLHLSWPAALAMGLTPFVPGNIIKIIAAAVLGRILLPRFRQTIPDTGLSTSNTEDEH